MTLSMNPLGFQLGVAGCVSPLVLVHRTIAIFAFILAEFGLLP